MAKIRQRGDNWVSRVRWNKQEKYIALHTKSKVEAEMRNALVNKYELEIINGMEVVFPWISKDTNVQIKPFTVEEACFSWMKKRKEIRNNTRIINQKSLDYFISFFGKNKPIDNISNSIIIEFIDFLESKGLKPSSINIHLRTIKTMFRYWLKMEKVNKIPLIEQLKVKKKEPIYITDEEFQKIVNLEWLDNFYKRIFLLYRDTGMRLREPVFSSLDGSWIDIPSQSKSGIERNIELEDYLKPIFIEYKDWLTEGYGSTLNDIGDHISKMFKKALNSIGADDNKHFHSLRHTFAVRSLIKGLSIYNLKLLMGHSSVTTTEVYSNMNLKRVAQHFPKLVDKSQYSTKIGECDMDLWANPNRIKSYVA